MSNAQEPEDLRCDNTNTRPSSHLSMSRPACRIYIYAYILSLLSPSCLPGPS